MSQVDGTQEDFQDAEQKRQTNSFPVMREVFPRSGRNAAGRQLLAAHFDALLGPTGALIVGDPETVAEKILRVNESLGGHFPSHIPDERGRPAARENDARDRAARNACCSSGANRARV